MPYIDLGNDLPGIRSLVTFRPDTGKHLYDLVRVILTENNSLSKAERELIAAHVSNLNDCIFCTQSHASAARYAFKEQSSLVDEVLKSGKSTQLSPKMNVLLEIAGIVQQNGKLVSKELIDSAKKLGTKDMEIHDTVLIASVFCMFNRYVDGLQAYTPMDDADYKYMGEKMITLQYQFPKQ